MQFFVLALTCGLLSAIAATSLARAAAPADQPGYSAFLCAGQSNAAGRGTYDPSKDLPDPRIYQWDAVARDPRYQTIIEGDDPLYMTEGIEIGRIGPCHALAEAYLSTLPPDRRVLIIPVAAGNSGLTLHSPHPFWYPTESLQHLTLGFLYTTAITETNRAIAAAKTQFPNSELDFIVWAQGDNDNQQPGYANVFDRLLYGWRTKITGAATVPVVVSSMNPFAIAHFYDGQIDLVEKDTPRRDLLTAFAQRGDDLPSGAPISGDVYCAPGSPCAKTGAAHFSGLGQHLQALSIFRAVAYARSNVFGHVPGAPVALHAALIYGSAIHLQWTSPVSRLTRAVIEYRAASAAGWVVFPTPPAVYNDLAPLSDVNVTGLAASTAYEFRLADGNESGVGPFSNIITARTTGRIAPIADRVVALAATETPGGVTLTWLPPYTGDTPSYFATRYRPDGAGNDFVTAVVAGMTYTITGLTCSAPYSVQVAPMDRAGAGPYSIPVHFVTAGCRPQ